VRVSDAVIVIVQDDVGDVGKALRQQHFVVARLLD
jgi:hypothetical protein